MIFTVKQHPFLMKYPGMQIPLSEFIQKKILLLTVYELDNISHQKWSILKKIIQYIIQKNQIKVVVIDCTGEPFVLNCSEEHGPNYLTIKNEITEFCQCIIVTEDYTYFYKSESGIIFWPYNLWLHATQGIKKYYSGENIVSNNTPGQNHSMTGLNNNYSGDTIIYDSILEKTHLITCLNNTPWWHRVFLFLHLVDKSWFNQIEFSFLATLEKRFLDAGELHISDYLDFDEVEFDFCRTLSRMESYLKKDLTNVEFERFLQYESMFPIRLEYEKKNTNPVKEYFNGGSSVGCLVYARNAINVVTETSLNYGVVLTEKTAKPFMAYQIPIFISPKGANQFLQDIGLDMFKDYVPWQEWDNLDDNKLKICKIVEFLDSIMATPEDILKTHRSFHQRLIKNREYFFSEKFEKILSKQILQIKV